MSATTIEFITADTRYHAPYTHRVILLCEEKGIRYHLTEINLQHKPQWFLDIAPAGEVPVMRVNNEIIPGSFDIACYIDKLSKSFFIPQELTPASDFMKTLELIDAFGHALLMFFRERKNTIPDLMDLNQFMMRFNRLLSNDYFQGNLVSYLDFALIPHILQIHALESLVFPFSMLAKNQKLFTWFNIMMERKSVQITSQHYAQHFIQHLKDRKFFTQYLKLI